MPIVVSETVSGVCTRTVSPQGFAGVEKFGGKCRWGEVLTGAAALGSGAAVECRTGATLCVRGTSCMSSGACPENISVESPPIPTGKSVEEMGIVAHFLLQKKKYVFGVVAVRRWRVT